MINHKLTGYQDVRMFIEKYAMNSNPVYAALGIEIYHRKDYEDRNPDTWDQLHIDWHTMLATFRTYEKEQV